MEEINPGDLENKTKNSSLDFWKKPLQTKQVAILSLLFLIVLGAITSVILFKKPPKATPISLPVPTETVFTLSLESPADGEIVTGKEIAVKGKTLPGTTVVFYTETADGSVESDDQGNFEGAIALETGLNTLTITAFAPDGNEKSINLDIVYDDQIKGAKDAPGQAKKTGQMSPDKAIIGSVKKVNPNSVILEEKKQKKQIETQVGPETKIVGQNKKTLRLEALQPDDTIAVIASDSAQATQPGELKKAARIFVRQATIAREQKRQAVQGVITNIDGYLVTLTHQVHQDRIYQLLANEQTVIKIKGILETSFENLGIGQRIAAVGDRNEEGVLVVKRIHVIPGQATGLIERYSLENKQATPSVTLTITPTATTSPILSPTLEPSLPITPTSVILPTNTVTPSVSVE